MINPEYDKIFEFNVDQYLIDEYPKMNMTTRRSICKLALEQLESTVLMDTVDQVVCDHALTQLNWIDTQKSE